VNRSLPQLPTFAGPEPFLAAYEAFAKPVARKLHLAYWEFSCRGNPSHQAIIKECEEIFSELHGEPRIYQAIRTWLGNPALAPLVQRQLQLLLREYRRSKAPDALRKKIIELTLEVEETVSLFRPELRGRRVNSNELDRILLHESDDSLRRDAWEATRQVGSKVAGRTLELVRLRNELAQHLGFDNYFALAVDDEELDLGFVEHTLSSLQEQSEQAWTLCRSNIEAELCALRGKPVDMLMPWDHSDRFFQSFPRKAPERSTDAWFKPSTIRRHGQGFFRRVGLPIEELWEAADMMPREGKYPHAFCIGIDNPSDVRVLCNLDGTARWMDTTLHEFGHALYNRYIDPNLPWLLREAAHTFITEAVAMYFGRHAKDPRWLEEIVGIPPERTRALAGAQAESQLIFSRWAMLVTRFEQGMYADPDQDLGDLWWGLAGELQGLRRPDGHELPDWASKVHIPCYPAYYQNYIYGELLASQFRDSIVAGPRGEAGALGDEVGAFFKPLFAQGRSKPWADTVRAATGRDLGPEAWLSHFGRAASDPTVKGTNP
jgi:peptidyl-dipeptidase A